MTRFPGLHGTTVPCTMDCLWPKTLCHKMEIISKFYFQICKRIFIWCNKKSPAQILTMLQPSGEERAEPGPALYMGEIMLLCCLSVRVKSSVNILSLCSGMYNMNR